jgi:hypothetical protein
MEELHAWEDEIARKYPTRATLVAPKEVAGTYHDRAIDELIDQSQLDEPVFRSPPEVKFTEPVQQSEQVTKVQPAADVEQGSFMDRAMPIAKLINQNRSTGLHQPRLVRRTRASRG